MGKRHWLRGVSRLYHKSPTFLLAMWFFALLTLGTILLALPIAHRPDGPEVDLLAAFFTAVSAFCVTGLTVVETHDAFSFFGQVVIMLLIELGGVGIMTFAGLAFSLLGRHLSMVEQAALADTLFQNDSAREFKSIFTRILKAVVAIQLSGVAYLYLTLAPVHAADGLGNVYALWSALFHSISAFCNAGFSIYRDNLIPLAGNIPFLAGIAGLVILGGLGHAVLAEIYALPHFFLGKEKRSHWFSLNARVTLGVTAVLLVAGGVLVAFADKVFSPDGGPGAVHSVFHSIVARTAGFNSAPLADIPLAICLFLCLLMFIGGSPGSCAGGVKTTSLAIWIARLAANLRHSFSVNILGYTIAPDLVSKARVIMALSTLWVILGVIVLSMSQPEARLGVLLFEQISALATVGLSMGFTPELNEFSRIWIAVSMIMGKFGPLTVALWMVPAIPGQVTRPAGRIMIG